MNANSLCLMIYMFAISVLGQPSSNPFLRGNARPFLVIAHRGARAYAPENTLPAFEKGVSMGAQMFELDVHLTKDGVPIVVHDDTLARCSNVEEKFPDRAPYLVSDFTLEEIKRLDAGSWFVAELRKPPQERQGFLKSLTEEEKAAFISDADLEYYESGEVTHPTLKEALLLAKERNSFVNVEIKNIPRFYPDIAEKVVKVIEETDMTSRVLISSFDHEQVVICKEINPGIATAVLCEERIIRPGQYCVNIAKADACHPWLNSLKVGSHSLAYEKAPQLADPLIQNAREAGVGVHVWTVNEPADMKILIQAGVTGIFSDYPDRLVQALKEAEAHE